MKRMAATRRADAGRELLSFRLGDRLLALPCRRVVRVARITSIVPLPSDLPYNLGIVVHRGVAAGLLDLAGLLDGERGQARAPTLPSLVIFARFPRGVAGFPVDELLDVEGPETIGKAPAPESPAFEVLDLDALESTG
ncbi:MAG: chemotaxis protein CheW [Holophagales bacterium]|nr:chemotaxis protein CheW [Holophagales bacterium]